MAEYLQLEIVTPQGEILSRRVEEVVAPGTIGEFGALPGHTPFLTTLRPGVVIAKAEDKDIYIAVTSGFAEVEANRVIILAEGAQRAEDIDVEQTEKDLELAKKKLESLAKEDPEHSTWELRLKQAEVKLNAVEASKG